MNVERLDRRRILVVEDEAMIATIIEDVLSDLGCEVVGPVAKLESAIQLAREEALDGAILDVTIRGGKVFPAAEILRERGIPFVLSTGYGDWALPDDLLGQHRLTKPFNSAELERAIRAICAAH